MNKTLIQTAFALAFGSAAFTAHAATLYYGNTLTITSGTTVYDSYGNPANVSSGSWFGIDIDGDNRIDTGTYNEKTALSQGTSGIVIGVATTPGASHPGLPSAGDSNGIDAPWAYYGQTGSHYTTVGITGSTTAGLDMSGWAATWDGVNPLPLGGLAWTPLNAASVGMAASGYANGIGIINWDGIYGHAYTLDYTAAIPNGDPSGLGGIKYALHLEGVVAVPEASTYAMMLVGLGLVGLVARRRMRRPDSQEG